MSSHALWTVRSVAGRNTTLFRHTSSRSSWPTQLSRRHRQMRLSLVSAPSHAVVVSALSSAPSPSSQVMVVLSAQLSPGPCRVGSLLALLIVKSPAGHTTWIRMCMAKLLAKQSARSHVVVVFKPSTAPSNAMHLMVGAHAPHCSGKCPATFKRVPLIVW